MLLGSFGNCLTRNLLLGNLLTGPGIYGAGKRKGAKATSQGRGANRAGEGTVRAGYGNKMDF